MQLNKGSFIMWKWLVPSVADASVHMWKIRAPDSINFSRYAKAETGVNLFVNNKLICACALIGAIGNIWIAKVYSD